MVDCLNAAAGILARSQGVFKGTGADKRFVKNALKICVLPSAYYKYWFLSYYYFIQQNTTLQTTIYFKNENKKLATISTIPPPSRDDNCAYAIKSIRFAAPNTATSPFPPRFAMQSPAVIAESIG